MNRLPLIFVTLIVLGSATGVNAAPIFFGPTPYLSSADIPAGFYAGGTPTALEDFEDGSLDFGITASSGFAHPPSPVTDSVDADDGTIDGSGRDGRSWFLDSSSPLTFTFDSPVTAAGIVWTDGDAFAAITFEAFGPGMVSLGSIGPFVPINFIGGGNTGQDRFFGVQDLTGGIIALRFSNQVGAAIEVDHVQFGDAPTGAAAVPEPSSMALLATGAIGLIGYRRRKRKQAA